MAARNGDELQLYMQFASAQRRYRALPQDLRNRVAVAKNFRLAQFNIEQHGPWEGCAYPWRVAIFCGDSSLNSALPRGTRETITGPGGGPGVAKA
jgi:hypothetical protein